MNEPIRAWTDPDFNDIFYVPHEGFAPITLIHGHPFAADAKPVECFVICNKHGTPIGKDQAEAFAMMASNYEGQFQVRSFIAFPAADEQEQPNATK